MKKEIILIFVIILIIAVIVLIESLKPNNNADKETMHCIASHTQLYVLKTCGHCAQQKQILGDYLGLFEVIDCGNEQKCKEMQIKKVPTWFIDNRFYKEGVLSIEELKQATGC